jgi:hypothetical protein
MKLNIEINRQDYADFNKFHFINNKLKKIVVVGIAALIVFQFYLNQEKFDLFQTIFSSIVFIFLYSFIYYRWLKNTKNIPNDDGAILGKKELDFTDDCINYQTENSSGTYKWALIKNLKKSPKAFYLYIDNNLAIVIPKRSFINDNEEKEFLNLAERKINNA